MYFPGSSLLHISPEYFFFVSVTIETRVKKPGRAKPLFLAEAPARQTLGATAEMFPEIHH
jgi:hypothetical protein